MAGDDDGFPALDIIEKLRQTRLRFGRPDFPHTNQLFKKSTSQNMALREQIINKCDRRANEISRKRLLHTCRSTKPEFATPATVPFTPSRYPPLSSIAEILVSSARALNGLLRTCVRGLSGSSPSAALCAYPVRNNTAISGFKRRAISAT